MEHPKNHPRLSEADKLNAAPLSFSGTTLAKADTSTILPSSSVSTPSLVVATPQRPLATYCDTVRELWRDMTMQDFSRAMRTGIREVDVSFKLTVATIAASSGVP